LQVRKIAKIFMYLAGRMRLGNGATGSGAKSQGGFALTGSAAGGKGWNFGNGSFQSTGDGGFGGGGGVGCDNICRAGGGGGYSGGQGGTCCNHASGGGGGSFVSDASTSVVGAQNAAVGKVTIVQH